MWVTKLPSGKYQYVERYTNPLNGQVKRVSMTLPQNRRADRLYAQDTLRARIRKILFETSKSPDMTLRELNERYLVYMKRNFKNQTYVNKKIRMKVIIEKLGENTLVSELTAPLIKDRLYDESNTAYNTRLKHFKAMVRWAYQDDYIKDISFLSKIPKLKDTPNREKIKDKYLERDELVLLLENMKIESWRQLTKFLALSGLRIGEAIALTKDDIDIENRKITINKTYTLITKEISSTKTETSDREIFIQDELYDCLKEILSVPNNSTLVFGADNEYMSYSAYAKYLKENATASIGRSITPHALRHTHVSLLAECGVGLETISRRLGHADSIVTKEVYLHVTERARDKENQYLKMIKLL